MKKSKKTKSPPVRRAKAMAKNKPTTEPKDDRVTAKMINLKAQLAAGELDIGSPVFHPEELERHGDSVEEAVHAIGAPLTRWRLISGAMCIKGEVHRADGPAAGDGDTNFELLIPKLDAAGQPSEQVRAVNDKIDVINQFLGLVGAHAFVHIEDAGPNKLKDEPAMIGIHCEVDENRREMLKADLAGMMIGDCYEICGQLVLDTWHGGLYEIHPVQTVDRC